MTYVEKLVEDLRVWKGANIRLLRVEMNPFSEFNNIDFRLARPNDILTADFNSNRINIFIDNKDIIRDIKVG